MKAQQGGGLEDDGRADEPTKAQELGTEPEEPTVGDAKIGRSAARTLQDQELLLQEDKAADQGHPSAGIQRGWIYLRGQDIEKDHAEALNWFRKAADHGSSPAQYNLGTLYAEGQGAAKDDTEAVKWLCKAAEQGHGAAQYALGGMYAEGRGVEKDHTQAVAWFRKAAAQGYAAAQSNLRRWSPV